MVELGARDAPRQKNECEATFGENRTAIRRWVVIAFGLGSVGTSTFIVAPQLLLLYFMTERLGIPAAWAGAALLIPKLWELVVDPLIGVASDRRAARGRHRRGFLLAGALLFPLAFALMFVVPDLAAWPARLAFVTLAFIAATTGYSLFAVPYIVLPGELTHVAEERTRLVAWRMGFVAVGILIAGGAAPALVEAVPGDGYAIVGATLALIAGSSMLAATWAARHAEPRVTAAPLGLRATLQPVLSDRGFRRLGGCYLLQMMASGMNAAVLAYAARHLLGAGEALVGAFFLSFTLASLAATPLAAALGRRAGKARGFALASLLYAAGFVPLALAADHDWALWLSALLTGVGNAGTQVLVFAMLPDLIDASPAPGSAGAFTGIWIAGEKLGLAIGAAVAAVALDLAGFIEGAGTALQPASAITALTLLVAILPAGLMLLSLAILGRPSRTSNERLRHADR